VINLLYINDGDTFYNQYHTVITIGNFDGFHRGHKKLVIAANSMKADINAKSLIMSFFPRPVSVLKGIEVKSIFTKEERIEIAESLGIDILVEYPFTREFASLSGFDFINMLKKKYNCKRIVVGEDFAFGKNRMCTAQNLTEIAELADIEVYIIPHQQEMGAKISSTDIRNYLENGKIEEVNKLIGHDYFIQAKAEQGDINALEQSFLSIHMAVKNEKLLPRKGVYTTQTVFEDGKICLGVTYIKGDIDSAGSRTVVETYIQNPAYDVYDTKIKVEFKRFICEETEIANRNKLFEKFIIDSLVQSYNYADKAEKIEFDN